MNGPYTKDEYFKKVGEIKAWMADQKIGTDWFFESTYPHEDTVASWERL